MAGVKPTRKYRAVVHKTIAVRVEVEAEDYMSALTAAQSAVKAGKGRAVSTSYAVPVCSPVEHK